jgi:putative CocE/NonD family hydrolase
VTEQAAAAKPGVATRAVDRLARRAMKLPRSGGEYRVTKGIEVPTRDGFHLLTDHYSPDTNGSRGTILVRGPYGRGFPSTITYGSLFAGAGYHVLVQSVRGTFGSTGVFQPFLTEAADAADTVAWLRTQSWFDRRLATVGGSYLGFAQWALLDAPPPELRAAVIIVGPHDFSRALYGSGAFALATGFGWSEGMAMQGTVGPIRGMSRLLTADKRTKPAVDGLPLAEAAEPFLNGRAPWYREWLAHETIDDAYWNEYRHPTALRTSEVPVLLVGGWHDAFLDQTIEQYRALVDRHQSTALTVGPWTHFDTVGKATGVISRHSLEWLGEHLAGDEPATRTKPVRLFWTGANEWREYDEWPPPGATTKEYFLQDGAALGRAPRDGSSTFTYDPSNPTPALAGRLMQPRHGGAKDNKQLESRADVLTFTSQPVLRDTDIIGSPGVALVLSVDNPHADVFVRLCDVDARGTSRNFSDGFLRLDPAVPAHQAQRVVLTLDPCAHRVVRGHRIRLQVSGGAHPRFARNLGTGEPLATAQKLVPSVHVIQHAGSRIILPIAAA